MTLRHGLSTDGSERWAITRNEAHGLWNETEIAGLLYDFVEDAIFQNVIDAREDAGEKGLWEKVWAAEDRLYAEQRREGRKERQRLAN